MYITATIEGVEIDCLVDSGATLSVIHPSYFEAICKKKTIPLQLTRGSLRMADGGLVSALGKASLCLKLPSQQEITYTFVVADVEASIVLGLDFLKSQHGIIDTYSGMLTLDGVTHQCHDKDGTTALYHVKLTETVTVQPGLEMIIPGRVDGEPNFAMGLVEPHNSSCTEKGLLVAKVVVDPQLPEVPVRVMNFSGEAQTLYKGTCIATCEPVSEELQGDDATIGQVNRISAVTEDNLPEHLQELYKESTRNLPDQASKKKVRDLLCKYAGTFAVSKEDLGRTDLVKHKIDTGLTHPIKQRPRRVPIAWRDEAKKEVDKMLRQGVVQLSSSPWASPVVLVRKKDNTLRYCIDYRQVNDVTIKDSYPLPRIDDTLDALQGATLFSTLDLASGYWQVEVDPVDKEKTAFVTEGGLYEFNVMPFGLCNAPATFERLMEKVLSGLHWKTCLVYIDDIIVFGSTLDSHLQRLEEVLKRITEANLKVSPSKCQWLRPSVKFLGHIVSEEGITTDPEKVEAVKNWPTPTKTRDVRAFLGLCSYYRRFIRGFADIARPLHKLTEKDRPFSWTVDCETAFQELKKSLSTAPVLSYPTPDDPFILDTDASGFGLGGVLSQLREGKEYVIAYYSHALSKTEQQYCVTRRELLAVVSCLKHFHHYVFGRHILVRTDHGALRWLMGFKNPEGQMARWLEVIGTYDLEVQHRAGRLYGNADGMSRRPCDDCKHCSRQDEKEVDMSVRRICAITGTHEEIKVPEVAPWMQVWTTEELKSWQMEDPALAKVIQWKSSGERPPWQDIKHESQDTKVYWTMWPILEEHHGLLYKRYTDEGAMKSSLQLVAPPRIRLQVMYYLHSQRIAGHLGVKKTSHNIRRRFWWPRVREDVKRWCRTCVPCQRRKVRTAPY